MSARHAPSRRAFVALAAATLACPALHAQTELTDLAKIRANGALKVAVYKDNAPFSDGKGIDMHGLDVALAQAPVIWRRRHRDAGSIATRARSDRTRRTADRASRSAAPGARGR